MRYRYKYRLDGFGLGCQPDDFISLDRSIKNFVAVADERIMTEGER